MVKSKRQRQAFGIKLSRERRSGKEIPPPPKGKYSERTRQKAIRDLQVGRKRSDERPRRNPRGSVLISNVVAERAASRLAC